MLTKRRPQVGYPPRDKELVPFFGKRYTDFDRARLTFSLFLGHLFHKVFCLINNDRNLANPKAWRNWLDHQVKKGEGSNHDALYDCTLHDLRIHVCGYFSARVAETSYAAYKEIEEGLPQTNLEDHPKAVS